MAKSYRTPPRSATNPNLLGWLSHDARMASVLATARRYKQIRQALAAYLPSALAAGLQVSRFEQAQLALTVPNAAHATKLRQLAPRLLDHLAQQGWHIDEIRIRIAKQASDAQTAPATRAPRTTQALTAHALQAFSGLHSRLSPGPLADAVARLLHHHHGPNHAAQPTR